MGNVDFWLMHHPAKFKAVTTWRTWHMNTLKLKCQHPTQIQTIFDNNFKTTNNQQQTEKNQQRTDKKRKDWPALGEVKVGEAADGGPDDEAAEGRSEEEVAFWVEPAFPSNEKDISQITYQNDLGWRSGPLGQQWI